MHFSEGGRKIISYNVVSMEDQNIKVDFEVDRVFRPISIGLSKDSRLLGVVIGELDMQPVIPAIPYLLLE